MSQKIGTTTVGTTSEKEMDELKKMFAGYLQCMVKCTEDDEWSQEFQKNPRKYLNEAGMRIPEGVNVIMDDTVYWPTTYIRTEQGEVAIVEKNYHVDITDKLSDDEKILGSIQEGKHIAFEKPVHVAVDVKEALKDSKVAIRFPFYNAQAQNFMEIKFADNSEIVMCTC